MSSFTPPNVAAPLTISSDQPIDDLARIQMETIARKGRGFVLNLAPEADNGVRLAASKVRHIATMIRSNRDKAPDDAQQHSNFYADLLTEAADNVDLARAGVCVEVKESLPPHDEWEAPASYRDHTLLTAQALAAYARRYGSPQRSLLLIGREQARLVIDETLDRGQREFADYFFIQSEDWHCWSRAMNQPLAHADLVKLLLTHEHNLADAARLIGGLAEVRFNTSLVQSSSVQRTRGGYQLIVNTGADEQSGEIPKSIDIRLPVLEVDVLDADAWKAATIQIDVNLSDDPRTLPTFVLRCPTWSSILMARIDQEGELIKGLLGDEWAGAVMLGEGDYRDRTLPHAK